MGHLFVGRQLLSDSPMKNHPLTPMRESDLVRLLQPQVAGRVGLVDRPTVARGPASVQAALRELAAEGVIHAVVDAVDDADLQTIAAACRDLPLLTGGSALAKPLPVLLAADGPTAWPRPQPNASRHRRRRRPPWCCRAAPRR
jgi:uncharacterized protein YgbK (DUF1537 family)